MFTLRRGLLWYDMGCHLARMHWRKLVLTLVPLLAVPVIPSGVPALPAAQAIDRVAAALDDARDASSQRPESAKLAPTAGPAGEAIETSSTSRPVARGIELETRTTVDALGFQRTNALTMDLDAGVRAGYLSSGPIASTGHVTDWATNAGAAAAVNGDFFDINNSGATTGVVVVDGQVRKSPSAGEDLSVAFDASGAGRIVDIGFTGAVGDRQLDRLNATDLPSDGIGAYTSFWGSYPRTRAVGGVSEVAEVEVTHGVVTAVRDKPGSGAIATGTTMLVGREAGADYLRSLPIGERVDIAYSVEAADGAPIETAIGGGHLLVKDGEIFDAADDSAHARTAIGFSRDGQTMTVLGIDGELTGTRGAGLGDIAAQMRDRGTWTALELDGGGSTTLATRLPGGSDVRQENIPNDGEERLVSNGLAFYGPEGNGTASGVWVASAMNPAAAPGDAPVAGGRPDRVFSGLSRSLTATPYDEGYGPAPTSAPVSWTASHGEIRDGVFRARAPGRAQVTASVGGATGSLDLDVLRAPTRIKATGGTLNLPTPQSSARFGVVGFDAHGTSAPVEPRDVRLDYDRSLLDIKADGSSGFTISTSQTSGSDLVEVTVDGLTTIVPVSVGLDTVVLDDFEAGAEQWTAGSARGTAEVTPVDGETGQGLELSYDFTQSTATRTAYAIAPIPVGVEGQTRSVTMSVYGSGMGEWTAFTFEDASGLQMAEYGPYITWEGWKDVTITVPDGLVQPIKVVRFYTIELAADRQYESSVILDNLRVQAAPKVEVPAAQPIQDSVIVQNESVDGRTRRFAVMSDAQFVASDPESELVRNARRTLREIRAQNPDFLVIAGDLVDEASEEDFQLARKILDEELDGTVPFHYVPGNHEVMGADIANFEKYFGEPHGWFDHRGTRFVTLDTSSGTLLGGGFSQVEMLRTQLDAAARSRDVNSVVLIEHHPPRDPNPGSPSQLGDRNEANLVEQWLADFQRRTGKGVAFVGGHIGMFHASRVDGVPYIVNGNSGKNPATEPTNGGFTGWTLFGVDPVSSAEQLRARLRPYDGGPEWIYAQTRPHVDSFALQAPSTVRVGESVVVSASVRQGDRTVPVAYPVSARWSVTGGAASFDADTQTLTPVRPGSVTLSVVVNDVQATQEITVEK